MRLEVSNNDKAQAAVRRLEDAGFIAYVPTLRFRKRRPLVQVADFAGHERVAGLQAQRIFEVVREVDPEARPLP